jgi:hypothetical protein
MGAVMGLDTYKYLFPAESIETPIEY